MKRFAASLLGALVGCSAVSAPSSDEETTRGRVTAVPAREPVGSEPVGPVRQPDPAPSRRATSAPSPEASTPEASTPEPRAAEPSEPRAPAELVATAREAFVHAEPSTRSRRLGYLRLGERIGRDEQATPGDGCPGGFYGVRPEGYVCVGPTASLDPSNPAAELAAPRPLRDDPLPYVYARSKGLSPPLYARLPSATEQSALEGAAYAARPRAARGWEDFPNGDVPALLANGGLLPTVFGFLRSEGPLPERAPARSAFALLTAYEHEGRRFGLTTDLELVPLDRVERVRASEFRGLPLDEQTSLPVVFVRSRHALLYAGSAERGLSIVRPLGFREAVPITGRSAVFGKRRYLETRGGDWLADAELVRVEPFERPPPWASSDRTWIHVSVGAQTLVAYVGTKPVYATLVSTGQGGLGDPDTSRATPRGEFLIHTKHVTATMRGDEVGDEYDLRDVPYVQYFSGGYAFHAAHWHDGFGTPRSHGCVNLSPIDARWLFHFSDPPVPRGWHGAFSLRQGTLVSITP